MDLDNVEALALLKRVAGRDQQAYTQLHRALAPRVFSFAMSQLKDAERAEEVVVDALHELWRHPERFNGTSKLSTWVLGIARYKILNAFRSYDDRTTALETIGENLELVGESDIGFNEIAAHQRQQGVERCMDKLSNEHRECMHLAFYESLSLSEIASVQACPENTVKTRLFHARQKIKTCLRLLLQSEGGAELSHV